MAAGVPSLFVHRENCAGGRFIEAWDRRFNSAAAPPEDALVDQNLKPMKNQELQFGVNHELTPQILIGARFIWKDLLRAIEDVGVLVPGVGEEFYIANPGEGVTTEIGDLPYAKPTREYDALELNFEKRFAERWSLRAYYTLSRLWGNYSGLANSDENNNFGDPMQPVTTGGRRAPNVSRLYDVPGSMYDQNGDLVYGRLATDRTHQLGAQFLYSFDFGLSVGLNQYIGSGTPISTIGKIPNNNFFYPYGRGDLGESRIAWRAVVPVQLVGMAGLVGALGQKQVEAAVGQDVREHGKNMRKIVPDVQFNRHARLQGISCRQQGVVQKQFGIRHLNEQRGQARVIAKGRGNVGIVRVPAGGQPGFHFFQNDGMKQVALFRVGDKGGAGPAHSGGWGS